MASKIFKDTELVILIGSSISLRDVNETFQRIELSVLKKALVRASAAIQKHLSETVFANYILSDAFVSDINNNGMILQRLEMKYIPTDGLHCSIDDISSYLESLAEGDDPLGKDTSRIACDSCRVYAFGVIKGLSICDLNSLWSRLDGVANGSLAEFDYKSLTCLLSCRALIPKLEKAGCDIGLEVYLACRSGAWLYVGFDEVYQEGLVLCEQETGFNPATSQFIDTMLSNTSD
jgi:hypothetical protein